MNVEVWVRPAHGELVFFQEGHKLEKEQKARLDYLGKGELTITPAPKATPRPKAK
jgi:hypothetical protein